MATYYVDPSQPTNGVGSIGDPLNSLPANFSSGGLLNGDILLFKRGTTYIPTWGGVDGDAFTVNRTVTIKPYGTGEKPIISSVFTGSGNGKLFRVFSTGCVFDSIDFRDISLAHVIYGQSGIADVTIQNCNFSNVARTAQALAHNAIVFPASGALTGTIKIHNNTFDTIGNDAVIVSCSGKIVLSYNNVKNVSMDTLNGDTLSVSGDCANLQVFGNICDHTNRNTKQCFIQDGGTGTGYAVIYNNIFNGYFGQDGDNHTGVYLSLPGRIFRNFIKTWRSAVFVNSANVTVSNNYIIHGNGTASDGVIYGSFAGMKVFNNTVVRTQSTQDTTDAAIRNSTSDASNEYRNNLIIGFNRGVKKGSSAVETNNAFWQVNTPVVDASYVVVPPDASDILTDPKVFSDGNVQEGSSLIGAGTPIRSFEVAYNNVQRNIPNTIGAFEYVLPKEARI